MVFPKEQKLAKVILIYKADDCHDLSNYRPISLLIIFLKAYEKCVARQITYYFNFNNFYIVSNMDLGRKTVLFTHSVASCFLFKMPTFPNVLS